MNDIILYDFSFVGFRDKAIQAYEDALPRFAWMGKEAKKAARNYRHYPYERGGYYINYRRWLERKGWHLFVDKVAFCKERIAGDVPIIMRFASDTGGNRYAVMLRVTENRSDEEVFAFSVHFMRRYAERQLGDREADMTEVARTVTQMFVSPMRYITTGTTYGADNSRVCLVLGVADGIAFGYYDTKTQVKVIDTYVHQSMLRNNQHHVFDYLHGETDDNPAKLYPLVMEEGKIRPMNEDELVDYIEHRDDPEYQEKLRAQKMWEVEQNRQRWERKAKRGADSVQVKRPQVFSPRVKPASYNPFDE